MLQCDMHNYYHVTCVAVGVDFQQLVPNPRTLEFTFNNQLQQQCAIVTILDDLIFEGNETFYASLTNTINNQGLILDPQLARFTIIDNEDPRACLFLKYNL